MELTEKPQSGHEYAETLLAAANKEQRGKLTVFLGAAAGVGKTCSMLQEAHARLREGTDIVLGLVLTHGRKETVALLEGLPRIPEQEIEYHGKMLQEMDLDAILRRRPQLVVVDELAHSNVPGSRHQRRYQDVEELLAAGIDVYTAVNIQHIESLNDVVAQITGSIVRETVPDAFFELADDIRLIDIPPKELLQRLKEGKVYRPQQAQQALRGFFRQGNISALRELALRFTARHVDQDMLAYMRLHKIEGPWPASGKVMVCVSASPFSAQLIRAAQRLAQGLHAEFLAVHIETPERRFPHGDKERERLWRNLNLAKELGGQILTTAGTDFVETVLQIAVRENVTAIVVGKSGPRRWYEIGRKTLVDRLIDRSGFIHVYVIQGREEEEKSPVITTAVPQQQAGWRQYVGALAAVVITTGLCYVFRGQLELVNISLLYLLPVLLTAAWWGRSTAYVTALFCVLGFDFLFLEPIFTFTIYDIRYLWSFLIFGLVAFLVGGKTESLRRELESTRRRESNVNSLYRFSSRIAAVDDAVTIMEEFVSHVGRELQRTVLILLPESKVLRLQACYAVQQEDAAAEFQLPPSEYAVAAWVQEHGQAAGRSTDTLPGAENLFLPLMNGEKVIGVVGIAIDTRKLSPEERAVLGAWVSLLAIALVRAGLSSEAKQAAMLREADKLRTALFNSVSHELRTPLAAIMASVYTLNDKAVAYGEKQRQQLLETIADASKRMERIIGNLLDTARLESGILQLKLDWCDLEDVVSGALRRSKEHTQSYKIKVEIADDLPLIYADAALLEHVVLNLLDNAVKYSVEGSEIEIQTCLDDSEVIVMVKDRGLGVTAKDLPHLFDKFYRVRQTEKISGTGLGLAICKGIVDAHRGRIWAKQRTGGGSIFAFALPVTLPEEKAGEKND